MALAIININIYINNKIILDSFIKVLKLMYATFLFYHKLY
jgi:hypothetical protein